MLVSTWALRGSLLRNSVDFTGTQVVRGAINRERTSLLGFCELYQGIRHKAYYFEIRSNFKNLN